MSAPRRDYVKRDIRECPKHGRTEFAESITGLYQSSAYICMRCASERGCEYYRQVKSGERVVKHRADKKSQPICPDCYMELPLSGICGVC